MSTIDPSGLLGECQAQSNGIGINGSQFGWSGAFPPNRCGSITSVYGKIVIQAVEGPFGLCNGREQFPPISAVDQIICTDTSACPNGQACCERDKGRTEKQDVVFKLPLPAIGKRLCIKVATLKTSLVSLTNFGTCKNPDDCLICPEFYEEPVNDPDNPFN